MMEISSRIKCLGELYAFSIERLKYYQELKYLGYCKHLQECMKDAGHELDELGPKLGFQSKNVVQNP